MAFPIVAAASLAKTGAPLIGALFANKKDPQRVQAAQDALGRALAGDATALTYMQQQSVGSATQVGKNAFKAALEAYAAQRTSFTPPVTQTPLQQVVSDTLTNIRQDAAAGLQQIGAGATTAASNRLAGSSTGLTVPLNVNQLYLLGAIAVAIILFRK